MMRDKARRLLQRVRIKEGASLPDGLRTALGGDGNTAILSEYVPKSWFHAKGIHKVLRDLEPRLPNVSGKPFITFTIDTKLFKGPASAYEYARGKLRKVFYALRQGVDWDGNQYTIDVPYCVKVEFHEDGWAHFHVIFLTRRFLPGQLLNKLWGLGRCNVQRISNDSFRYLLKYVCKGGELPEWVKRRSRLRVFQSSHGFLKRPECGETERTSQNARKSSHRRNALDIGERLSRWSHMGLLVSGEENKPGHHHKALPLRDNFQNLLGQLVLPVALDGRYLGDGQVLITKTGDLHIWL